jgi:hypothetical protein
VGGWHCYPTDEVLTTAHLIEDIARSLYYIRRLKF